MEHGMRVAQLVPALGDGGVERSALEMAAHLSSEGVENWVVSAGGRLEDDLLALGGGHLRLEIGRKSPLAIAANARALARWIDATGIDVLHARSRAPAWVGWRASRIARRKPAFLTTFHGVYGHKGVLKRWYNSAMLRGPVVIANSHFIRDHLERVYGVDRQRVLVAPRGVDPARFDPTTVPAEDRDMLRAELGAGFGDHVQPLLVLVARISRWKGHALLLDALEQVTDRPWHLACIGGADSQTLEADLKARVAQGPLAGRVTFTGSRADIPQILASADLAFSVSTAPEAFGRSVIEAGAMQTAVIGAAHGGTLETLVDGKTGWLFPPGDAVALAARIRVALSDPHSARAMGRAGRTHVLTHFTTRHTLAAEIEGYRRALAQGRPA
ncbi:Glycosyltransferase [Roseibacterium elongatum DSM 19469]|uniref:Glycosyltransferase n=1 Tax=Roseicyclus elongatus DSM 19469 TaxID=1294273 RepID=W8RWI6_9RHOB|nr:glycosyltransferase family 4 protein [Roseibacterium elongatum]AHM05559.1 Glycosyltransferase [Roseibacterium elongatum DSM 19469]